MANRAEDAARALDVGDSATAIDSLMSLRDKVDLAPRPPDWMWPSAEQGEVLRVDELLGPLGVTP